MPLVSGSVGVSLIAGFASGRGGVGEFVTPNLIPSGALPREAEFYGGVVVVVVVRSLSLSLILTLSLYKYIYIYIKLYIYPPLTVRPSFSMLVLPFIRRFLLLSLYNLLGVSYVPYWSLFFLQVHFFSRLETS